MLEVFSTLLTGVLSGGATGLIGILLQRYFDLQNKKQDLEVVKLNHANTIELAKLESARADARAAADQELAETAGENAVRLEETRAETAEIQGSYAGLRAAMEADKATYLHSDSQKKNDWIGKFSRFAFTLVDALRGFIRPGMTAYLCGLVTVMFYWVRELAEQFGVSLTAAQVHELMLQIVTTILYVFTTTTLFWFGTRPSQK